MPHTREKDRDLVPRIWSAIRLIRQKEFKRNRKGAQASGSFFHLEIMRFVREIEHPTMKEIAKRFGITPPSATAAIDTLVGQGLLKRVADSIDRRAVRIELTGRGAKVLAQALRTKMAHFEAALSRLSRPDRAHFARIIEKIAESL